MGKRKLPSTSIEARSLSHELAEFHKAKILVALHKLGLAMGEEIAKETGLDKWQIGRRMKELEENEKVYRTGIQRPTSTGRNAYCYSVTPKSTRSPNVKRLSQEPQPRLIQQTLSIN